MLKKKKPDFLLVHVPGYPPWPASPHSENTQLSISLLFLLLFLLHLSPLPLPVIPFNKSVACRILLHFLFPIVIHLT